MTLFNPRTLSSEEIKRRFTARTELFNELTAELAEDTVGPTQPHLIVGHRGSGKTTLLCRLKAELLDDPRLASRWLPLSFPEELYKLEGLANFWLLCLDALSELLDEEHRPEASPLDRDIEELRKTRRQRGFATRALGLLKGWSHRLNRRLVLLLDNVDQVLARVVDPEDWALKKALSDDGWLFLIGATCHPLDDGRLPVQSSAFSDFFQVHHLRPLDDRDAFRLLHRLAELAKSPHVSWLISRDPARVRTIRLLAGGNTRTLVQLFGVLKAGLGDDVRSDLERMLDNLTPIYQERLAGLTYDGQRLFAAMAEHWHPVSTRELAVATNMTPPGAHDAVHRLRSAGLVERLRDHAPGTERAGGKPNSIWQISERLFNIWYLMRAGRRTRRNVAYLVKFLRLFFSYEQDLADALRRLEGRGLSAGRKRAQAEALLALQSSSPGDRSVLTFSSEWTIVVPGSGVGGDLSQLVPLLGQDLVGIVHRALDAQVVQSTLDIDGALALPEVQSLELRNAIAGLRLVTDTPASLILAPEYQILSDGCRRIMSVFPMLVWLMAQLLAKPRAGDAAWESLVEVADRIWSLQPSTSLQWFLLGEMERKGLQRPELAERAYEGALRLDPNNSAAWRSLGQVRRQHLFRFREAEDAYHRCLRIDQRNVDCWLNLGFLLIELDDLDYALKSFQRVVVIAPDYAAAWHRIGNLLSGIGRNVDALEAHRKAASLEAGNGEYSHALAYAYLMASSDNLKPAREAATRAARLANDSQRCAMVLAEIFVRQGHWPRARKIAKRYFETVEPNRIEAQWAQVFRFLTVCVRLGFGTMVRDLLVKTGQSERLAPVVGSLDASTEPSRLAPEIHIPAAAIAAQTRSSEGTKVFDMRTFRTPLTGGRGADVESDSRAGRNSAGEGGARKWLRRLLDQLSAS